MRAGGGGAGGRVLYLQHMDHVCGLVFSLKFDAINANEAETASNPASQLTTLSGKKQRFEVWFAFDSITEELASVSQPVL